MFRAAVTVTRELEYADGSKATQTSVYGPDCAKLMGMTPKVQQRAKTPPRPVKRKSKGVFSKSAFYVQAGKIDLFEELTA